MKILTPIFISLLVFTSGCSTTKFESSHALFDDVTVPRGIEASYRLEKVDGKDVKRIQHTRWVTKIPFAILEPGEHDLLFKNEYQFLKDHVSPESLTLRGNFEAGKRYCLIKNSKGICSITAYE